MANALEKLLGVGLGHRSKIAAFSNRKVQAIAGFAESFAAESGKKESQIKLQRLMRRGMKSAAFPRVQNRSTFGDAKGLGFLESS